jgi:hypothetical protein
LHYAKPYLMVVPL